MKNDSDHYLEVRKLISLPWKFLNRLRARGVRDTTKRTARYIKDLYLFLIEKYFDFRYRADTSGIIAGAEGLQIQSEHRDNSTGYEGIQPRIFQNLLKHLPIDYRNYVFIDFGSGKGRALMMAAERQFKHVIGIEFSPLLHEAAQRNIDHFRKRMPHASGIELIYGDAAQTDIPEGDLVCFFYNPFDACVMEKVILNLAHAHKQRGQNIFIAYRNPVCADLLERFDFLSLIYATHSYHIYQSSSKTP